MARPVNVSVSRVIRCPRDRLAAFAADPANAPAWYANIESVEWQGPPSTEPGARAAFVARFMGQRLAYTYEIREHVPGRRLAMSTAEGPFPMETVYEWEDAGEGRTRMTLTNRGRPEGFKAVLAPLMALAMRRAMTNDLAALARVVKRRS
ncbi:MAG: ATPase [Alphaproteobacteria bacterium]|nr:MAG: ATPase [Alphaproteobacteria bacterium]